MIVCLTVWIVLVLGWQTDNLGMKVLSKRKMSKMQDTADRKLNEYFDRHV